MKNILSTFIETAILLSLLIGIQYPDSNNQENELAGNNPQSFLEPYLFN